jgi:hypothetical protein
MPLGTKGMELAVFQNGCLVSSQSGGYFDVLKRQALATSFTPSNVPSQLMYQFSFSSSSELGLLLAWVPYSHLVSLL